MKRPVAYVGDVHLDAGESAVDEFTLFLERLSRGVDRIVLMGDLFNLWVARPEFEGEHHRRVVAALLAIRDSGTPVDYLEGNRDFALQFLARELPEIVCQRPEATYLAWLDCRQLDLSPSPARFWYERADIALSDGSNFAPTTVPNDVP